MVAPSASSGQAQGRHGDLPLPIHRSFSKALSDARGILDAWRARQEEEGDCVAACEALDRMGQLQLCGRVFYVDAEPVAYALGEELVRGPSFVIHFEKAVVGPPYRGVYQYVNQAFAAVLPEKYETINREQDLGMPGCATRRKAINPPDS
ncbi:MAG: DUF2156 domain-containing protein [Sedimentisphaerales bacterium]|nr:DUF2156 domain-containing protein [Sedimentisphaerales bacterium]